MSGWQQPPPPPLSTAVRLDQLANPPIAGVETGKQADSAALWDITRSRRRAGYLLGALTSGAVIGVILKSLCWLDAMTAPTDAALQWFFIVKLVAHAFITVAGVLFCYQLLRIAERMVVPHWWLKDNRSSLNAILGVDPPIATLRKLAKLLQDAMGAPK